jgi:archaemetzincin
MLAGAATMTEKSTLNGVVIPIGQVDRDLLALVADYLTQAYEPVWEIGPGLPCPPNAYNRRRCQYQASALLGVLRRVVRSSQWSLGVADLDYYVPGLSFVFGLASLAEHCALIALPRLRQEFYGLPQDDRLFEQRVVKEAIHEIGHVCGLEHCPDPRCVMHFSNSLADTDAKSHQLCQRCREKLNSTPTHRC